MPTPIQRSKILPARGSKANLNAALNAGDLLEGELCYAKDEDALYQVEAGFLVKVSASGGGGGAVDSVNGKTGVVVLNAADVGAATTAQGALASSALQPGGNVSALTNDAGYVNATQYQALLNAISGLDARLVLVEGAATIDGGDLETGISAGDNSIIDGGVAT